MKIATVLKKYIISNKYPFLITFISVFTSVFSITRIFNVLPLHINKLVKLSVFEILFLIIVFFSSKYILHFCKLLYFRDKKSITILKIFLCVLFLNIIFLFFTWPGCWVWDEYYLIDQARELMYFSRNSYVTIVFYSVCLLFFPGVISITFIQVISISCLITYCIYLVYEKINNKRLIALFIVLFVLPPIIFNNLYPFRVPLYSYIELSLIFTLLFNYDRFKKISNKKELFLVLCTSILAIWRSEGIFYLLIPLILYMFFNFCKKRSIIFFILCFLIIFPFKFLEKKDYKNSIEYEFAIYIQPLSIMLNKDLKIEENVLAKINRVLDLKTLKDNPSIYDISVYYFHKSELIKSYNNTDIMKMKTSFLKLVLKNPNIFFDVKIKTFLISNGILNKKNNQIVFREMDYKNDAISRYITNTKFSKPFNYSFRASAIKFIWGYGDSKISHLIYYTWNAIPSIIFMLILFIFFLFKKKFAQMFILAFPLFRTLLIFLTAPATFFMYYFSIYLIGIFLFISFLIIKLDKLKAG